MQAMDLPKNALQWETERQNRIHQDAIELKKKQMEREEASKSAQPAEKMIREVSLSKIAPDGAEGSVNERTDALRRIPEMRSALMPWDEDADGASWSKPFSLLKADLEPWLSYYNGYAQSRLFLSAQTPVDSVIGSRSESVIDYAVRALLELKQASPQIILDPPVQISGPVEYIEFEAELKACRDPLQAATLIKYATEAHGNQLRQAIEKGRSMGNLLHDALMGEGHANLIKAWVKTFNRKPSVEELHLMLTTGRIKVSRPRPTVAVEVNEQSVGRALVAPVTQRLESVELAMRSDVPMKPRAVAMDAGAAIRKERIRSAIAATPPAEPMLQPAAANSRRKTLHYALHAAVGFAALAAYGMWMFA